MIIKFQDAILCEPTRSAANGWVGPSSVRLESVRTTAECKYIGAPRAFEKELGNVTGILSFNASNTCATVAEAVDLAIGYEESLPKGNGTLSIDDNTSNNATIKSVITTQVGVTVHATITLALGNTLT